MSMHQKDFDPVYHLQKRSCPIFYFQLNKLIIYQCNLKYRKVLCMMAQEGHSPVLVFDSPVLIFTQSSFNFNTVQF